MQSLTETGERLKEMHLLEKDGLRIAYDVNDLVVFEIDEVTSRFLGAASQRGLVTAAEQLAEEQGENTARDLIGELRASQLVVASAPPLPAPPRRAGLKGVTLNVMHGCNLACTYCFAKQGDYGLGKRRMTEQMASEAVDWAYGRRDPDSKFRVGFFGGEPMMNMPTVRSAVDHSRARGAESGTELDFHITTNGTLLNDENVEYLADNAVAVQVSLDGAPEVNDRRRIFRSGKGSYNAVAQGAKRLKARTQRLTVRGTIPAENPEFGASVRHVAEHLGATTVAFEPGECKLENGVNSDEVMARIRAEWTRLAAEFEESARRGELKPYSNLVKIMRAIHARRKVTYGCQAAVSNMSVDPSGDIYPCHRFVGEEDWKIGNIGTGEFREEVVERFVTNTVDNKEPCRSCWARYTCGGRCAHEAKEATGTIHAPDPRLCDLVRHLTELALVLYVKLKPIERQVLGPLLETAPAAG